MPRIYKRGKENPLYNPNLPKNQGIKIKCACNCGELIDKYDNHGTERKWKEGHHLEWLHNKMKGVPQPQRVKDEDIKTDRELRTRGRYYYFKRDNGQEKCIVYDKQICRGPLGIFFIDDNMRNFKKENLALMCHSHKIIMRLHQKSLQELKDMKAHFYTERKSGKRRWMVPGKNYHA